MSSPTKKSTADDVTSRLTDPSKYTGSHKNRFDSSGKGKGIDGRVDRVSGDGYVVGYTGAKDISATKTPSVVDRLTDPSKYTGAHKSRFDPETGKGLGVNQIVDKDIPNDLSDMTRPALHKAPRPAGASTSTSTSAPLSKSPSKSSSGLQKTPSAGLQKSPSKPKTGGSDIFDRLTDSTKYTGSHKNRFDSTGKGKGIEGRVERADNTGYVQGSKISK